MKIYALASLSVLSVCAAMSAGADVAAPGIVVRYADLDLTSAAGSAALYRRLDMAAMQICMPANPALASTPAFLTSSYKACVNRVVLKNASKVKSPEFAAYIAAMFEAPAVKLASR
jgi:UrcA family protein